MQKGLVKTMKDKETKKLYDSITNVDSRFIELAQTKVKKKKSIWLKVGAAAACFCLIVTAVGVSFPYLFGKGGDASAPVDPIPLGTQDGSGKDDAPHSSGKNDDPTETADIFIDPPVVVTPKPATSRIVVSDAAGGDYTRLYFTESVEAIPEYLLIDENTPTSSTAAVYSYKYGNGQGGPFFKYSDEDLEKIKSNMSSTVSYILGPEAAGSIEIDEFGAPSMFGTIFIFEARLDENNICGLTRIVGTIDRVTLNLDNVKNKISVDDILNDPFSAYPIGKCIEYADIGSPETIYQKNYYLDQSLGLSECIIFDSDQTVFENDEPPEFRYISLFIDADGTISTIDIVNKSLTAKVGEFPAISYAEALDCLRELYPDDFENNVDQANIKAMRVYSYDYKQQVNSDGSYGGMGFYEPCYRFYLGGTGENSGKCAIVDVRMSDFDAQSVELPDTEKLPE